MLFTPSRLIALLASLASSAAIAAPNLVVNGSLSGALDNDGVPTGWQILAGSPDVMDVTHNTGLDYQNRWGATPSDSTDGGTWVGLGSYTVGGALASESFGQVLNGLVVGATYTLSWEAANFGYSYKTTQYTLANAIQVSLGGAVIGQGATLALGDGWQQQSLTFTATATSQLLGFSLAAPVKSYLSIDNIQVTPVSAVPEPATAALMGMGLAVVGLAARRRRPR